jgi:hypothetical protein
MQAKEFDEKFDEKYIKDFEKSIKTRQAIANPKVSILNNDLAT